MATYEEIYGKRVEVLSSDPSLTSANEGQVWYNSTTGTLKSVVLLKAWVSSTPTSNTFVQNGGCGTQTAALTGAGSDKTNMEEYNGLGWTTGGAAPDPQELMSQLAGTQTAAIMKSGLHAPSAPPRYNTEAYTYNGTSWSSIPAAPGNRVRGAAVGTQTAFLCAGGAGGPPTFTNRLSTSIEYDGSWTAGGALSTARAFLAGLGTQTAAIMAGGAVPPSYSGTNVTEQYDGTSFSSLPTLNTARHGLSSAGTTTSNIVFGGGAGPPFENKTESYDGTAWTVQPTMGTGRTYLGGAGADSTAAVAMCGNTGSASSLVEEYNTSVNTFTAAAWASGTALGTGRESMSSAGTQTAALAVGGRVGPPGGTTAVEDYDGSSWESAPVLNTARQYAGGCGTQTAAITYGGGPPEITTTEEFNGSSWSTQPNSMSTARRAFASFGIQTAAVAAGGQTGTAVTAATEEYNGTSWSTSPGSLAQARQYFAGAGIESSGLAFGGSDHPNSTKYTNTEEYGGTSWTTGGVLPTGTSGLMGCGATNTAALAFGGYQPSKVATTVGYDGTAWSSRPSMGGATAEGSGAGTSIAALSIGGSPAETGVEEFTGEVETVTASTLTTG